MIDAKRLLETLLGGQGRTSAAGGGGLAGTIGTLAREALGTATQGVGDAARRAEGATGIGSKASDALTRSTGRTPDELLAQAKDLIGRNQMATGAILGSLGGLLLGSKGGRSMATSAAKVGGLVLIGGLAWKAYQNYQAGRPVLGGGAVPAEPARLEAPRGSGFEPEATSNHDALTLVRAMIAAAAADGMIDETERSRILGGVAQAGFDAEATDWLAGEFARPASIADLATAASNPAIATEIYTAARIAIEPDHEAERTFLADLSRSLRLEPALVANIEAAVAQARG